MGRLRVDFGFQGLACGAVQLRLKGLVFESLKVHGQLHVGVLGTLLRGYKKFLHSLITAFITVAPAFLFLYRAFDGKP